MRLFRNHVTRTHGYVALAFLVVFGGFTLFLVCQPKNNEGLANIVITTLAVVAGPMVGAVARDFQSCCLEFSLCLLPWSGAFLVAGALFQFVPFVLLVDGDKDRPDAFAKLAEKMGQFGINAHSGADAPVRHLHPLRLLGPAQVGGPRTGPHSPVRASGRFPGLPGALPLGMPDHRLSGGSDGARGDQC